MKQTIATVAVPTAVLMALVVPPAAEAQQAPKKDRLLDAPYVTSTGATVPNPGKSQSGGTTPLDRKIQRKNDKIDSGICKGC